MIGTDPSNEKHRPHKLKTCATEMEIIRHAVSWESWASRGSNKIKEHNCGSESVLLKIVC